MLSVIEARECLHHRFRRAQRAVRVRARVRYYPRVGVPRCWPAIAFGGSPYVAAHLFGHFDLLTAWVIPLFALFLRRALNSGRVGAAIGCGVCVGVAAYSAYYYVVYLAVFALAYTAAAWQARACHVPAPPANSTTLFTLRLVVVGLLALDAVPHRVHRRKRRRHVHDRRHRRCRRATCTTRWSSCGCSRWPGCLTRRRVIVRVERPPADRFLARGAGTHDHDGCIRGAVLSR